MSLDFVNRNRHTLDVRPCNLSICHSNGTVEENVGEIVYNNSITIGGREYRSNWAVSNTRYDIILGMPWHKANKPIINYETRQVKVENEILPTFDTDSHEKLTICNISVKKFRSMLRKEKNNTQVFMVHNITNQ